MKTSELVKTAVFAALIFLATAFIKIPSPLKVGYIHAGDIIILASCYFLKPKFAAISAGIGSMFADLMAGYAIYMPVTLVIKAAMALIAGLIMYKKSPFVRILIAFLVAEIFMLAGYFVFEGFIIGWAAVIANIPFSLIQPAAGIVAAIPLVLFFKKIPQINRFRE